MTEQAATQERTQQALECVECKKTFVRPDFFKRHMEKHKKSKEPPASTGQKQVRNTHQLCPICSKTISRKFSLERHMRLHNTDKPYACERCNKSFGELYGLLRHVQSMRCDGAVEPESLPLKLNGGKVQKELKTYECVMCGITFKYKEWIDAHFAVVHRTTGKLRLRVG